jgi:hypothetical protein
MIFMRFKIKVGENQIGLLDGNLSDGAEAGIVNIAGYWRGAYPFYPNNQIDAWDLYETESDSLIATGCRALPALNQINPYLSIMGIKPSHKIKTE